VKTPTKTGEGDIIAREFFDGQNVVGESTVQLKQVAAAVAEGYDEAQNEDVVPPPYQDAHKHYFGELKKVVEAQERAVEENAEEGADEAPAEPAADDADGEEG
jgi:hypothetical protein